MASIRYESGNRDGWRLRYRQDGKQKSIWLGKLTEREALDWKHHVPILERYSKAGRAIPVETEIWLLALRREDRDKLVTKGLWASKEVKKNQAPLIEDYLEEYVDNLDLSRVKPRTVTTYRLAKDRLLKRFTGKRVDEITPVDARSFQTWLSLKSNGREKEREDGTSPLSEATVRGRISRCKTMFQQAVDDGIIEKNPFAKLRSTVRGNKERMHYVDIETFDKLFAKAPDATWRTVLLLARIAGLRIPSEIAGMDWDHVDFEHNRLLVLSPKTEHHEGQDKRVIPLFERIRESLEELKKESTSDEVFPHITGETNMRTQMLRLLKQAKIEPWPKLWQNLRASAATDLIRTLPVHVATRICGHSAEIAKEHYWQVTDSDLDGAMSAGIGQKKSTDE